ncbi:CGCGG family rSAM-modified RiPP protein [Evansella sp. AB-P1]|uniref:CGCGG family putative rSAM-modified RiPP protein n=1 Tax=Evansella sp. AB-P1 TaxID=3037653 RepID=UPI00242041AA|nr:CGCGG family rSAM-modified RiPP protein [Evansella sp. AB-P1]MDG5786350.1 CGCGG family rSAM-modified RiPP protein [Evansella sp. AB-P1]
MKKTILSWSASLEHGEYELDQDLVIQHGIEAVDETTKGAYVNLVTPNTFGNPVEYLSPVLKEKYGDSIQIKYIDQCGCGGYVLRIYK